jgi:hypothetical protein
MADYGVGRETSRGGRGRKRVVEEKDFVELVMK